MPFANALRQDALITQSMVSYYQILETSCLAKMISNVLFLLSLDFERHSVCLNYSYDKGGFILLVDGLVIVLYCIVYSIIDNVTVRIQQFA